ncbi:MAG: DUF433 domain-containing protein [Chloroflexi bacterium]|nr:DUF433 domain-containing protein [Chloroflexota bacterium]
MVEKIPVIKMIGDDAFIADHRITVAQIAENHYYFGQSLEVIQQAFPSLTLAEIHAALAYYHANKDEMDRQIQEDRARRAALDGDA